MIYLIFENVQDHASKANAQAFDHLTKWWLSVSLVSKIVGFLLFFLNRNFKILFYRKILFPIP